MRSTSFVTRSAAPSDVPRLVELNRAAYPDLVEEGVVFDGAQLLAQQAVFPDGQVVLEDGGRLVGAIATLIVQDAAASAPHTWGAITSQGTFAGHDPRGDVLYLADVYVDPQAQGRGVGRALYEALFQIADRRQLPRIVAGGRLWGYHEVADQMGPEAYVAEVVSGRRRDPVLGGQLRAGFRIAGILPGYLDDWRSASFATHLVYDNPRVRLRTQLPRGPARAAGAGAGGGEAETRASAPSSAVGSAPV